MLRADPAPRPALPWRRSVRQAGLLLLIALVGATAVGCGARNGHLPEERRWLQSADATKSPDFGNDADHEPRSAAYDRIYENTFLAARENPLSTFSVNVDTASYSNVRRFLTEGKLPPKDAVRVADFVNYFRYDYPQPVEDYPIAACSDVGPCPWNSEHRLVRIGLQARRIEAERLPPRNLVFLIDVSGSMDAPTRLPLVKQGLNLLVDELTARDRVAIVVYAGHAGLWLPATPGNDKATIRAAVDRLNASGSTNGGEGIVQAYRVAQANYIDKGVNRVILATDGDFNVGVTSQGELLRLIEEKRKSGVYLTVLGFGMGNLKDSTLEKLADKGAGHYAYIDSLTEAHKVFVEDGAALVTVAKDVKVQVEFNPRQVSAYRLIGYENRLLRAQDFNDDQKAATPMGAGHTVTALYEVVPAGKKINVPGIDPLKYQEPADATPAAKTGEVLTIKIRYKEPREETSQLITLSVKDDGEGFEQMPADFRFAAATAEFGLLLRDSPYKGSASYAGVRELAQGALGSGNQAAHRAEFLKLVMLAETLAKGQRADRE
jgi:Ca-activated chloride channel family protein